MRTSRKVLRNFQDYGLGITIRKAFLYPFRWLYHARVYRIYRAELTELSRDLPGDDSGLTFRLISHTDTGVIDQIEIMEEWLHDRVAAKIRNGGICLVAMEGETLAGFNLVGFGRLHIPAVDLDHEFRPGAAWSEQISVGKDFRGRGVASQLRYRIFAELAGRGIRRFYGGTMTDNLGSLKLARKVGFRELVDIHYLRLFGSRRWRCTRVCPEGP